MTGDADHHRTTSKAPSLARVYDYFLGGSLNSPIDRRFAGALQVACPALPHIVRDQRAFLQRYVQYLVSIGVRQFLDLGSGLPTVGHIHHVANAYDSDCAVLYVDNDPMVVSQGAIALRGDTRAGVLHADIRYPHDVLRHEEVRRIIDPSKPVGIVMIGVFEFIADQYDPPGMLATYQNSSAAETYIAITTMTDNDNAERNRDFRQAAALYASVGSELTIRPPTILHDWLAGMMVIAPGITTAAQWASGPEPLARPDTELTPGAVTRRLHTPPASGG